MHRGEVSDLLFYLMLALDHQLMDFGTAAVGVAPELQQLTAFFEGKTKLTGLTEKYKFGHRGLWVVAITICQSPCRWQNPFFLVLANRFDRDAAEVRKFSNFHRLLHTDS